MKTGQCNGLRVQMTSNSNRITIDRLYFSVLPQRSLNPSRLDMLCDEDMLCVLSEEKHSCLLKLMQISCHVEILKWKQTNKIDDATKREILFDQCINRLFA